MVDSNADKLTADVAIAGGGLAGLTAGVALAREGLDIVLVEADRQLGGRARSWTDESTGDPIHIGPHVFMTEYPNMFQLLDWLGTRDKIVWQQEPFIVLARDGERVPMRQYALPAPLHFAPTMLGDEAVSTRDKISNFAVTFYAMQADERDFLRLDGINAYAFLRQMGVTKSYIETFWSFAALSIMNMPIELCSAGALLRFYKKFIGYSSFCFGFPDGGLGDLFAPGCQREIEEHGGRILLETEVTGFTVDRGRVTGLELDGDRRIVADHTVSALTPQVLRRIGRSEWTGRRWFDDLVHFHPVPYACPYIWFDRKLSDLRMWARPHNAEDLNTDFYDLSNIHTGWEDRPSMVTSNIIYSHRVDGWSDEEIVRQTVDEIAELFPEASMDRVTHWTVNRIPMAICSPYPGTERRRPTTDVGVDGLSLAGDWTYTKLPSSMEGACRSGWRAAEHVLAREGRSADLAIEHRDLDGVTGLMTRVADASPVKHARRRLRDLRHHLWEPDRQFRRDAN